MPGVELLQVREIFNRAWNLFRKREWWKSLIHAGVKGEEFTLGDERRIEAEDRKWSLERDGYHFHLHVLVCSGWVEWKRLGEEWSDCLSSAAREAGVNLRFNTAHGRAVVDVRLVVIGKHNKARKLISFDEAIEEVSKYITKNESWLNVGDAQLLEVASIPRWFRSVELLGACRTELTEEERVQAQAKHATRERAKQWRADLKRARESISTEDRLAALHTGAEIQTEKQWTVEGDRFTVREVEVQNDFNLYQQARAELSLMGELQPEARAALEARTAYLDVQNLSDGAGDCRLGEIGVKQVRARPLRVVAREKDRLLWLEELDEHVRNVQEWRKSDLSMQFQYATFSSLAGAKWFGVRSNPASSFRTSSQNLIATIFA